MSSQAFARKVDDTYEGVLSAGLVDEAGDTDPDLTLRWVSWSRRFSADAQYPTDVVSDCWTVAAEQYDSRGSMAGNVGDTCVDYVVKVDLLRQKLFNQGLPKLSLHERVVGYFANEASGTTAAA